MSRIENKINRQVKKHLSSEGRFSEDLESLRALLEKDVVSNAAYLSIIDGFPNFLSAVADVYGQYDDKYKMSVRNLDISSRELNDSNRRLELLNSSMKAVLESLGPALLFFDAEGVCAPFYSKSCSDILECKNPEGRYIWDVLGLLENRTETFKSLVKLSFNNDSAMSCEDIFEIAPKTFQHSKGKNVFLYYKPILSGNGEVSNILVIAVDKTQEMEAQNSIKEKEAYAEKIIHISHARNDYIQVLKNIESYFLDVSCDEYFGNEKSVRSIKGGIHTLKGLAGSFQIKNITSIFHDMETYIKLQNPSLTELLEGILNFVPEIKTCIDDEEKLLKSIFGEDIRKCGNVKNIKYDDLFLFLEEVKEKDTALAKDFFKRFLTVPIFDVLSGLDLHLRETARALNKKVYPCRLEGENIPIPVGIYDKAILSFVHFMRNSVDHGIETPEKRLALGKDEYAQVVVTVGVIQKKSLPWVRISFSDDGSGIDVEKIKVRLIKNKIDISGLDEQGILMCIFKDDVSSKSAVSEISGRGIGLSVIKKFIDDFGGDVSIQTTKGAGTTFVVELPYRSVL